MADKVNLFELKCNGKSYTIECKLDAWDDIKFDAFLYLRSKELYDLLQDYINGNELAVIGTDWQGKVHEEKVIKPCTEIKVVDTVHVPHIVLFVFLDYINQIVGFGSVINVMKDEIRMIDTMEVVENWDDVYYLGVFCKKINCSPFWNAETWNKNWHYYIEKK